MRNKLEPFQKHNCKSFFLTS